MATDRIIFTAEVEHPKKGRSVLQISVPVRQCWEHGGKVEPDEDTPTPPHVHSESGYHTDYVVCFGPVPL